MTGGSGGRAPRVRLLRGAALAALSALLTAVGHVAGGGTLPDLAVLVVLLPMLAAVFVSVAQRCRSTISMIATLGAGQLALHEFMTLLHPAHAGAAGSVPSGATMLGMHAAVTLAVAVALQHADRATAAVGAAVRRLVPRRLAPLPADRPLHTLVEPGPGLVARIARVLSVADARRGPPVGC
ncbi:hypothetical protein [Pseudonocardia sp. GCM10023141]|uniref:hypothetical protein n=1 Tax=Pseudonocardia sp. GCM10023141 TaxID=3252653 RepID=UPI00361B49A1